MAFIVPTALPPHYVFGLLPSSVAGSATQLAIGAGSCIDSTDTTVLNYSGGTISVAATGALGYDAFSFGSGTITSNNILTLGSSVTSALGTKAGAGTGITTSGTTVTGIGTLWWSGLTSSRRRLGELAVGDLIGNATNGWSRVTAITGETTATLAAALPGGNIGVSAAYTIIENVGVQFSGAPVVVNTLNAAGTVLTVPGSFTNTSYSVTFGLQGYDSGTNKSSLSHVWLRSGVSGVTATLSTQRTTPYAVSGYAGAFRRIGSWQIINNGGTLGVVPGQMLETAPFVRFFSQLAVDNTVPAPAYAVSGTFVPGGSSLTVQLFNYIPPTSKRAYLDVQFFNTTANFGTATVFSVAVADGVSSHAFPSFTSGGQFFQPTSAAQTVTCSPNAPVGNTLEANINVIGYEEVL